MMNLKYFLKRAIQIAISCNFSPTAMLMHAGKKHFFTVLDRVIPDEKD